MLRHAALTAKPRDEADVLRTELSGELRRNAELQQRVDEIGERTHRLHELLPIIRREILNRRAEMLADAEVDRAENVG